MADIGVVSVVQPAFIDAFGDQMLEILGADRADQAVRIATATAAGIVLAASSDRPVAEGSPLRGIQAMAERLTASGRIMGEGERVPVQEALVAYTRNGAIAAHRETEFGMIASRLRADLVVLGDDPVELAIDRVSGIAVLATLVDGLATHDREFALARLPEAS